MGRWGLGSFLWGWHWGATLSLVFLLFSCPFQGYSVPLKDKHRTPTFLYDPNLVQEIQQIPVLLIHHKPNPNHLGSILLSLLLWPPSPFSLTASGLSLDLPRCQSPPPPPLTMAIETCCPKMTHTHTHAHRVPQKPWMTLISIMMMQLLCRNTDPNDLNPHNCLRISHPWLVVMSVSESKS